MQIFSPGARHIVTNLTISETVRLPLAEIQPPAANARKHTDEQLAQLEAAIRTFGFVAPVVVDEADTILAGHGRWLAAKRLKLEAVPCIRISGLSEAQKVAFSLADNRIALNSEWDERLLSDQVASLLENPDFGQEALNDFGFGRDDLLRLDMLVEVELAEEASEPVPRPNPGEGTSPSIWDPVPGNMDEGLPLSGIDSTEPAVPYTVFLQQADYDALLTGIAKIKRLKDLKDSASALVFALTDTAHRLSQEAR